MQVVRRILSAVLILAFALGTTAQAAQMMSMTGMMEGTVATLDTGMDAASSPTCPGCGDIAQGIMDLAACQGRVCVAPSMLPPPEAPRLASMPTASPVPHAPPPEWGETPHPEPHPPKSTHRI